MDTAGACASMRVAVALLTLSGSVRPSIWTRVSPLAAGLTRPAPWMTTMPSASTKARPPPPVTAEMEGTLERYLKQR
jgi:hypothetical protein